MNWSNYLLPRTFPFAGTRSAIFGEFCGEKAHTSVNLKYLVCHGFLIKLHADDKVYLSCFQLEYLYFTSLAFKSIILISKQNSNKTYVWYSVRLKKHTILSTHFHSIRWWKVWICLETRAPRGFRLPCSASQCWPMPASNLTTLGETKRTRASAWMRPPMRSFYSAIRHQEYVPHPCGMEQNQHKAAALLS